MYAETTVNSEGVTEYHASARNPHGTGYEITVSNPLNGMVDILIYQVVCHEVSEEPSVSLSLPVNAAWVMVAAMDAGLQVATYTTQHHRLH